MFYPVFDGLLPSEHNCKILDVLFSLANWHALAKLRQHTDLSLVVLEEATVRLGEVLRHFQQNICMAYETKELKREVKARTRKTTKKTNKSASGTHAASAALPAQEVASGPSKVTGKIAKDIESEYI